MHSLPPSPLSPPILANGIASLMNIPGSGFARIRGRLRPSRKKILRKNGVFKRVINDISGFSREDALSAFACSRRTKFFTKPASFRIDGFNAKALTRLCVGELSYFRKFYVKAQKYYNRTDLREYGR